MNQNLFSANVRRIFGGINRWPFGRKESRSQAAHRCPPRVGLETLEDRVLLFTFNDTDRWASTGTDGGGLTQGAPTKLTWGFATEGTNIPKFRDGEQGGDSKLINFLDTNFGAGQGGTDLTQRPWFSIFNSAFTRLGELSGVTYKFEPADDGVAFNDAAGSNPGLPGVRPDIRIGGRKIDGEGGSNNTLAYAFLPNVGDMVIDTHDGDILKNSSSNFFALRNVLMHEAAHGLGIQHVRSSDGVFLMETGLNTTIDGPQLDDILALHRGYGDALEKGEGNNSAETARDLGSLTRGATIRRGTLGDTTNVAITDKDFLSLDDESDFDYFKFTVADPMTVSFTLTPRGAVYHQGPENSGTQQSEVDAKAQCDLQLKLLGTDGSTILKLEDRTGSGGAETISNFKLSAAGTYYLKVSSGTTDKIQLYGLDVAASDNPVGLSIDDVTVTEKTGSTVNAVFTVSLATESSKTVTVDFATSNNTALAGSDYTTTTGSLTFLPGEKTKTITVTVLDDSRYESNETFFVRLSNATNSSISVGKGHGTIVDSDPAPGLSINNVFVTEKTGSAVNAVFTVTLSPASLDPVTVDFTTANGSAITGEDFSTNTGTLTFAPGKTTQTITVAVTGDTTFEAAEIFFVTLSGATNAAISDPYGEGTIKDNDLAPKLTINDVTVTEGTGNTVDAVFTVKLSAVSGVATTVNYTTANSSATSPEDFTTTSGTVTIAAGATSQTITVPVAGDLMDEVNEKFFLNLTSSTNATIADSQGIGTVVDDDSPAALSVSDVILTEGSGTTVNAVFTISIPTPSSLAITVNYATANGTATSAPDYILKRGSVVFAPGQTSKTVVIPIKSDHIDEADEEAFFLNLTNPKNATIADGQGQCTIRDDDPIPTLSIKKATVTEGTGGAVKANFVVDLVVPSGRAVTVDYATADDSAVAPADYTAISGSLTFAPGQTSKTITVMVAGDALHESFTETFFVNLTNPNFATVAVGRGEGTITDNDAAPKLSINKPTITEGTGGTVNLVFTVTLSAASGQTVTVNYATANGTTIASDYTGASGSLTFGPGETTKTITVSIVGDSTDELNETILVNLSDAINALFANSQGVGTILDND